MNASTKAAFAAFALEFIFLAPGAITAEEPVVVRLWNWNIHDKKYQQNMYKLFNQRNPGIKLEYSSIANTMYDQVLEAAFVAKDPPDLFLPSGKLSFTYLRTNGMIKPLNDVVPSEAVLKELMARYPPQLHKFVEGLSVFDGKVYMVDTTGESYQGTALAYNKTLFRDAGIGKSPATHRELRAVAAKVAQAGQGKYFGISHGLRYGGVWDQDLNPMVQASGFTSIGNPSYKDGRFHTYAPEVLAPLKAWMGMREDGSVYPGETTMNDEQAKMAFATNKAALFFGGPWIAGNFRAYDESCDFDLVLPPTPDDGVRRGAIMPTNIQGSFGYVVASSTKHPDAVWKVIDFICSLEYQKGYVAGGYGISYLPEANKPENFLVPQMYRFVEWAMDPALKRVLPVWSQAAIRAWQLMPGVYPPITDVLESVYLGKSGFDALADLDRRLDEALDAGIGKAQEAGIKVTRNDFVFPDWDPTKDYVPVRK